MREPTGTGLLMQRKEEVIRLLEESGISYELVEHEPVYTMEEMERIHLKDEDCIAKNLFLRDDKHRSYYLVSVRTDARMDLKSLREILHSRPLSFASEADLMQYLSLTKGSVTPLGLLNDRENKVIFVLDESFVHQRIGVHPLQNSATVFLNTDDLCQLVKSHVPIFIKL